MSVATTLECPSELITDTTPDWHLAQILHSQCVPLKEICDRCHVPFHNLQKRISKEGWSQRKEQARQILSVTVQTKLGATEGMEKAQADSVQNASNLVRQTVSGELLTISSDVAALKRSKGSKGLAERLGLLKSLTDVSKDVFGWGQGSTSMAISISNLSSCKLAEPVQVQPTIDVGSVGPSIGSADSSQPCTVPEQIITEQQGPVTERS